MYFSLVQTRTLLKKSIFAVLCCSMSTKRTYQPKVRKRSRTHGFLVRTRSPTGSQVLKNRRRKGRARLAV